MTVSQNGWPVVDATQVDNSPINGHKYPNGFLKGDVWTAFEWLFTQLDARVEKVSMGSPPDEWGWYVKNIEGTSSISNHASGTAGDYNAKEHPMGSRNTYSAAQRDTIHRILKEANGIFRWGGDYTGRPDDMHFEIVKSRPEVAAFVQSIKPQGRYKMDISLTGYSLPTLHFGDDDSKKTGYNYVTRAQLLLNATVHAGLKVDGVYGPATRTAVVKLASSANGNTIGLAEWTQLYGLVK